MASVSPAAAALSYESRAAFKSADARSQVAETLEGNNTSLAPAPIRVGKTYGATVVAELDKAPAGTSVAKPSFTFPKPPPAFLPLAWASAS